jgi:glucose uptake protein
VYTPHTYPTALALMLLSMICWGSWANTQKADARWRFELFYLDYNLGLLACAALLGLTLGNLHPAAPDSFFSNLHAVAPRALLEAIAGGIVFTTGNLLLVAAISIAGMSVAFPVGSGLGLVLGAVLNYLVAPRGNPLLIFSGIALVCLAIALDALAYRAHSLATPAKMPSSRPERAARSGETPASRSSANAKPRGPDASIAKGLILSIFGGIGAGLFYPLVAKSLTGPGALNPYTVNFVFGLGAALSAIPITYIFMRKPVTGPQLNFADYFAGRLPLHAWGVAGGLLWGIGTIANFVASYVPMIGPATSFSMGEGNTMISALWGVFVWREFSNSTPRTRTLLAMMFLCFLLGLTAIALAPIVR